MTYLKTW